MTLTFGISYIIATRNRLPFLKITLEKLISEIQPDEEIVVVDGNSTDGSKQYLQTLFDNGKIHQFVSEPDKNQAHAWNKAMLMANGAIIKKIIDDDVFCYKAIRKCKNYMLQNPKVDVVISNDLVSSIHNYKEIGKSSRLSQFEKWKRGMAPSFTFGDVHLLIRRSSLAYIGLYNTAFVMLDWEYSLRISYLKSNIVYYTGYNALSVAHPQTVSSLKNDKLTEEQGKRGCVFYEYEGDRAEITAWSKIKISAGKMLKPLKTDGENQPGSPVVDINSAYNFYYDYIRELNDSSEFEFLLKD
jgi:glycosyltransferase involved in cell wall biosynthesis